MKKAFFFSIFLSVISFSQTITDKLLYLSANKVELNAIYQSLKIGDEKLDQFSFPISIVIPVSNRFTMSLWNGSAMTKYSDYNLNALGETKIGVTYIFNGERLMVKGIFGLPTGKTKLTYQEFIISQLIAINPLDYPITYYGQGLNANLSIVYAYPISKYFVVGLGGAYKYHSDYYPRDVSIGGKFDPGDEILTDFGFDLKFSKDSKMNFDFVYTVYAKDQMDDVEIFKMGNKMSFYLGFDFVLSGINNNIFIIYRKKSNNHFYSEISNEELTSGDQVDLDYMLEKPIVRQINLFLNFNAKLYQNSDQFFGGELIKIGKANVFGFGGGLKFLLSDFLKSELFCVYKTGDITHYFSSEKKNISGFRAGLNLTFKF